MNPRLLLPVLTALACAAPLHAVAPGWNVTAECQMVTLPQKLALALLPDLQDEQKIEAAFARVQELIAKGEAQLVANLIVKSLSGEPATAESVEEIRYATEFDPPNLPQGMVDHPEILEKWPHVGVVPTAMETRKAGAIFESTVNLEADGVFAKVDCDPSHVRLLRNIKLDAGRLPNGEHLFVEQPIFHTLRNQCSLYLRSGQRVLVGFHKLTEPADTVELFFLRVSWVKKS
jgi:hypothetical protein